jgi:hypothetical protein
MAPEVKTTKNSELPKLPENFFERVGKGGCPPISTWINPTSLGRNGIHWVELPHQMRKCLLNLALGEPLALVQELPFFDDWINLDPFLSSALDMCVHNMIIGFLLHVFRVDICWFQLICYL